MVKTTVYLEDDVAAALRRMAARTGRSQAEIIRGAVAEATAAAGRRRFRSHGVGRGSGEPIGRRADELLREELRARRRR